MWKRYRTYGETFYELLNIEYTPEIHETYLAPLENEGRTEYSICYAIWRSRNLLEQHVGSFNFWDRFAYEICKWSWSSKDPLWKEYGRLPTQEAKSEYMQSEALRAGEYEVRDETTALAMEVMKQNKKNGVIYFVQADIGGPIKIGFTRDLKGRLDDLQTACPYKLVVLMAIPAAPGREEKIHRVLWKHWMRGEWFKDSPVIYRRIARYREKYSKKFNNAAKVEVALHGESQAG